MTIHVHAFELDGDSDESEKKPDIWDVMAKVTSLLATETALAGDEPDKSMMPNSEIVAMVRDFTERIVKNHLELKEIQDAMRDYLIEAMPKEKLSLGKIAYLQGWLRGERIKAERDAEAASKKAERDKEKAAAAEVMDAEFINEESTDDVLTGPDFADNPAE